MINHGVGVVNNELSMEMQSQYVLSVFSNANFARTQIRSKKTVFLKYGTTKAQVCSIPVFVYINGAGIRPDDSVSEVTMRKYPFPSPIPHAGKRRSGCKRTLPLTQAGWNRSNALFSSTSQSGATLTSSSVRAIISPFASLTPAFRACDFPRRGS